MFPYQFCLFVHIIHLGFYIYRTIRSRCQHLAPGFGVNNITLVFHTFRLDNPSTAVVFARARSFLYKLRTPFFPKTADWGTECGKTPSQRAVVTGGTPTDKSTYLLSYYFSHRRTTHLSILLILPTVVTARCVLFALYLTN